MLSQCRSASNTQKKTVLWVTGAGNLKISWKERKRILTISMDVSGVYYDLCSRKIIGYAYGASMTAELAAQAVKNACLNVKDTKGMILHKDLWSQYTGQAFEKYLANKRILHSFSWKWNPYDNACIESFHSVLKKEEIYLHTYQDLSEVRQAIFEYIES